MRIIKFIPHLCSIAVCCATACWATAFDVNAVTLKFIVPSGATSESSRFYLKLTKEFELEEPNIKITFVPLSNWDNVVGTVKDMNNLHQNAGVFVAEVSETLELEKLGLITPFQDALEQHGVALKNFIAPISPEFLGNSYCANKKFCGPPFLRSIPVALYNLDRLKQIGISKEQLPTTWGEMEMLLEKLKTQSQVTPFCLGGDWYDYLFEAMVLQAGGTLMDAQRNRVTLATPEAVEALRFWKRLKDKKLLMRAHTWKATLNGFVSNFYPVTYYSSGGMQSVRDNAKFSWMADMLPMNKIYAVAVGGGNIYLSAHLSDDETSAALKLVQFMYRPSIQARISANTGFFPTVDAAFAEPELKEHALKDEPFIRARRQLKYAKPRLMSIENLKIRDILKKAIDRALDDDIEPADALQKAQREVDQILGQ
jgi:sn-glycerol 3-phosphate transport system substrate-binding protein